MRILHVSDVFWPRVGGIENQVGDLAAHQAAGGHQVTVLTTTPDGSIADRPRHPTDRLGDVRVMRYPRSGDGLAALRAQRWDVVHCHASVMSPLTRRVALAAGSAGIPTAVTVHSLWSAAGPFLAGTAGLLGIRRPRLAWSAVSDVAAGPVRQALGLDTTVTVLPNAVDIGWWRQPHLAGQTRHDDTRDDGIRCDAGRQVVQVVSVQRMTARKRPLPLLRIAADARRQLPDGIDLRLVVVGDGPQLAAASRLAARPGMSFVHLTGRLDRNDIRSLLTVSDLFVAPAEHESFGIAALEARAAGLPVIAKRRGGVAGFITHGRDGLLHDTDAEMASALAALAADATRRRAIAAHNRAVPPAHDWPQALARTDALYTRAAELARAPHQPSPDPVTHHARVAEPAQ